MTQYREVRTTEHEQGKQQRIVTFKATQMIWLILGLIEATIALRVVFKLIGVNPANPFAALLYSVTNFFVAPFASLTSAPAAGGMVLEISSLIAMLIYLLIAWGLERIVYVLFYRPRGPVSVSQMVIEKTAPFHESDESSRTTVTESTHTQRPGSA